MRSHDRSIRATVAVAAMLVAASFAATAGPVSAANPGVRPPSSHPYGHSYDEWGDRWWQWVDGIPQSANPMVDPTGASCGLGQSGQVWFLAGSPGGSYDRACTVPVGKGIFFPVANFQEDQREVVPDYAFFSSEGCADVFGAAFCADAVAALTPDPTAPSSLRDFINLVLDSFVDPGAKFARLDGVAITNLADYRSSSGAGGYAIHLPDTDVAFDNYHSIFGYAFDGPDDYLGAQAGCYLMLSPLSPGAHLLEFGEPGWTITYHLTVQ